MLALNVSDEEEEDDEDERSIRQHRKYLEEKKKRDLEGQKEPRVSCCAVIRAAPKKLVVVSLGMILLIGAIVSVEVLL